VEAYPIPTAYFSTDPPFKTTVALPKFRIINQSTVAANPFNPSLSYKWDFGTGNANDTSSAREPRFAYGKDTATYKIQLITTSNHGCSDTFIQPVYIGPDIIVFIPNVFTPDGVGPAVNNRFTATAQNYLKGTLYVYNRWGEILHKSEDLQSGWDGNSNGVICPQGVYAYYLELYSLDMKKLEFRGTVTLLR
jgi:gliding motility-associated-like protein